MSEVIQINPIVLGGGGGVSTDWFLKVWENTNPTASFSAQTITLSSGVGDLCLIEYLTKNMSGAETESVMVAKGDNALLDISIGSTATPTIRSRVVKYVDSTHLNVLDAYVNGGVDNTLCIPLRVWYIQKNGLAGSVSTLASNCMLSNGDSVEDVLGKGSVSVNSNGVKTWSQLLDELFALIDSSKITSKSIFEYETTGVITSVYHVSDISPTTYGFVRSDCGTSASQVFRASIKASGSTYMIVTSTVGGAIAYTSGGPNVVPSGRVFRIIY